MLVTPEKHILLGTVRQTVLRACDVLGTCTTARRAATVVPSITVTQALVIQRTWRTQQP